MKKVKKWSLDKCKHQTATKMKGAKVRVEPKTIHTADAFATLAATKSAFYSNQIILTLGYL